MSISVSFQTPYFHTAWKAIIYLRSRIDRLVKLVNLPRSLVGVWASVSNRTFCNLYCLNCNICFARAPQSIIIGQVQSAPNEVHSNTQTHTHIPVYTRMQWNGCNKCDPSRYAMATKRKVQKAHFVGCCFAEPPTELYGQGRFIRCRLQMALWGPRTIAHLNRNADRISVSFHNIDQIVPSMSRSTHIPPSDKWLFMSSRMSKV